MKSYMITEIGELKLKCVNDGDIFKEVCIDYQLPSNIEKMYEVKDYDISVRFFNDGEIAVILYDNDVNESTNIQFESNIKKQIIDFAKSSL